MKTCVDPKTGLLLIDYAFGQLSDEDRVRFESHMLECTKCFSELCELGPELEFINANKAEIIDALKQSGRKRERADSGIGSRIVSWLRPAPVRVAIGFGMIILLFTLIRVQDVSKIAVKVKHDEFRPGIWLSRTEQSLVIEGVLAYSERRYEASITAFKEALRHNPDSKQKGDILYFCALSFALLDKAELDSARSYMEDAIPLIETGHRLMNAKWTLANIYLEQNALRKAEPLLKDLAGGESEFSARAREKLGQLRNLRSVPLWKKLLNRLITE